MAVHYTIFCKHARKVVHIEQLYVLPQSRSKLMVVVSQVDLII